MRCSSCGTENRAGRKFCSGCGLPLAVVCPSCGEPNEPGERFCGECGTPLEAAAPAAEASPPGIPAAVPPEAPPKPHQEERRLVTVLFADLAGFTKMSEAMDPEAVKALAEHVAQVMSAEVRRFGGTVSSVMGDAIMAMFGAPVAHEDDAERAVRAAVAMRESIAAVRGVPVPLQLHVGINTGETMAGHIGPDEARDYTAMGDTTNTAARLMGAAPTGSIYLGEMTHSAVRHAVVCREVEPVAAKGKAEPVRVWEVEQVLALPGSRRQGTAPLVGREAELRHLLGTWDAVLRERRPRLAMVLGQPGIGKSRLLEEFGVRAHESPSVISGRCLPYGEGITYWPVIEMIKEAAGIMHDDPLEATTEKLGAFLEGLGTEDPDQLRTMATAMSTLLGAPTTPRGTYLTAEITQGELHWGFRRTVELMAERRPVVLLFEDLHWAEPTLLDLVDYLATEASDVPVLILGSARPELADSWNGVREDDSRTVLRLEGLSDADSEALIASLLPAGSGTRTSAVLRAAGGNPLFLEETVQMLSDAGTTGGEDGDEVIPVAGSLQTLIGSRLDLLPEEERDVAQLASVGGQVFWSGMVSFLEGHASDVVERLSLLELRDLVRAHEVSTVAGELEFAFKHALIRDVAYGRLPKLRRSDLHARCADWVSALSGTHDELVEIIGYHLETACRLARELGPHAAPSPPTERAADALRQAGEKAERREGIREADRFYVRALEVVGDDAPETAAELGLRRARTLSALGRIPEATELLEGVAEAARSLERRDLLGHALVQLANVDQKVGRASAARDHLTEARSLALDLADIPLEIRAAYESAAVKADFDGDPEAAVDDLWLGVELAKQLADLALRIEGYLRLGTVQATAGRLGDAKEQLEHCIRLAGETGSYRDDARATYLLAYVTHYLGDSEEARRLALKAAEWLERTADRYFQIQNGLLLSRMALTGGDVAEAEEWARRTLPLAQELGGWLHVEACRYLVEILALQGSWEEAERVADVAEVAVPEEDAFARAGWLLAQGFLSASNDAEEALALLEEGIGLMEGQEVPIELAEARISAARVLLHRGGPGASRRLLEGARGAVVETEAVGLLGVIDALLAKTEEGAGAPGSLPQA
jgi:class 3 adenylate cyclase/predicted ATPase